MGLTVAFQRDYFFPCAGFKSLAVELVAFNGLCFGNV